MAIQTVPQSLEFLQPRHGTVSLSGYRIVVRVQRGHLILQDRMGVTRREGRFARIGHGLRRVVVIGADGWVSLAALRWLADQDASFVMLERNGKVLATTGPARPSDARLRRAQALAIQSGVALEIARQLITQKLDAQAKVVREKLLDSATADTICEFKNDLPRADSAEKIRLLESRAARAYWSVWSNLTINFPRKDLGRVPHHWKTFGSRISALTGSPRLAVNPPNAILNYLYATLESEARLAAAALGLDPGLGVLHVDNPVRDSLACDLMEPVRPKVDAYVLDWILHETLHRDWFFEQRDGNCRLMAPFVTRLSETEPVWGRAVAPVAEWVTQRLWTSIRKPTYSKQNFPTRLTQRRRTEGRGREFLLDIKPPEQPPTVCSGCGAATKGSRHCPKCGREISGEKLAQLAKLGRTIAQSPESRKKRSETQFRHEAAKRAWGSCPKPDWPDETDYIKQIQPALASVTISIIASKLGVSESYAAEIRAGKRTPHPRHWQKLMELAGGKRANPANS